MLRSASVNLVFISCLLLCCPDDWPSNMVVTLMLDDNHGEQLRKEAQKEKLQRISQHKDDKVSKPCQRPTGA